MQKPPNMSGPLWKEVWVEVGLMVLPHASPC